MTSTISGISRITLPDGSTVDVPAVLAEGRIEIVAPQQFVAGSA